MNMKNRGSKKGKEISNKKNAMIKRIFKFVLLIVLIILVLFIIISFKLNILNEDLFNLRGVLFSEKFLSVSVQVREKNFNLTLPYGIYEPLCCDNNLRTGEECYARGYVDPLTEEGAVYCDAGDAIYKSLIQHRFSIIFRSLSVAAGERLQCILETSGTESQPGQLFVLEGTPGVLTDQDFYLNYTFNKTSNIILIDGSAAPWYIHNCSVIDSLGNTKLSDKVNKRIYVHKSISWTDVDLTKVISCEGGSSGVFMNNIDRCLRSSPENVGSSKEYLYAFNLYGGGTVEGKCYDNIDNDYFGGADGDDETCKTWWDNYTDRTRTLLPGFDFNLRSEKGVFFSSSFIFDSDNLNSILLPNTNTLIEHTLNNNPGGYMKFRFKNSNMRDKKYNIFLYGVPKVSSLTLIGNGPGISSLTSANLRVTLQASGKYTLNLLCDNDACDDGGYLDIVMLVNFTDYSLDGSYPIGLEFTFTSDLFDTGINTNVYFDSANGLNNTNESESSLAVLENLCNDSKNNDLDISFDYNYINNSNPPNRIDFSRDCADESCQGKTGPSLNGLIGVCYYKNESLGYPLSCRDSYDNDWNDNYLTDVYGYEVPSADYTDCHDLDCFRLGGLSDDILNYPCPAFENNSADWCGDGINNDRDYVELGSGSGIHSSSCIFPVDSYTRIEPNSLKYLHTSRIYDSFDCRDFDCNTYDGNISIAGLQKCEYGREISCNDGFNNDGLQLKDCEIGNPVGRTNAPSYNTHAEYDCDNYCRQNVNSQEVGDQCADGKDNDWDFWSVDSGSFYTGIENVSGGVDCRWINYNPDEDCNNSWMNVSGTGYWQVEKHPDIVQCQLGKELNCTDNFDNDIDRDSSNLQSGWQGKNDSFRVYNNGADCADYDCKNVKDSNGNYRDVSGTYACPINERYKVNSGGSYSDNQSWCFDNIDNDLDGLMDCKDPNCLNAINPSPGQNGLNNVLICAAYELNASALLDNNVLTVSSDYCGNQRDDENNPVDDNTAVTIGGVNWFDIQFNSINQPILNSPGVAITDCGDDDCYRKFGSCAPCSSNEFVNWNSCFDGKDNDHDGKIDILDEDCNGKIVNERGYNLTNNPQTETDNGGSCSNQYEDDSLGDISYIHPFLECRNEQIDCGGRIFGSDGRVCPFVYTENDLVSCNDNIDNDGVNGIDCYDVNCFGACGITAYNGNGNIYNPQNASASVGVTTLVYSKITKLGGDFYYTYSYTGTSNGDTIYLDLGHASDKSKDINSSVFDTSEAVIVSNNCPTCGFVLFKTQPGFLRVRGTSRGNGFSVKIKIPSLGLLMNPENILASTSIGAAFGSTLVEAEVVNNQLPTMDGIVVEPRDGKIFAGDPIYMRGYNFTGFLGGQIHSGQAGWCKINITGAIDLVLENPDGSSERNCIYTTIVNGPGTYNFEITPYDINGNEGNKITRSLTINSVAPIIYSKLTRDSGKRVFFTINNESLDSFADVFNGKDGIISVRFKTTSSYPYNSDSCFAIIRNENNNVVSIQKIESSGGYLTTCTADVSIKNLNLDDGAYTVTINATDGQGYSLETQRVVFYICNNLNSKGETWDCGYADFDVDGYTEGILKPFNYSDDKIFYKLACDSCPGMNNTGQDSNGDGIDDACDNQTLAICGNGILEYGEQCDDGNVNSGDGCSSNCKTETPIIPPGGGGGGGGGGAAKCKENWNCLDWSLCDKLSEAGEELNDENKNYIQSRCNLFGFNESSCGFKIRFCEDLNECSTILTRPETLDFCYYIYQPNCFDKIKNQDEEGIDCGGSCEPCEIPKPVVKSYFWLLFVLGLLVLIVLLLISIIFYRRMKIKIILLGHDKFSRKIGEVNKDFFKKFKPKDIFNFRSKKYRLIKKDFMKVYVNEVY